MLGTIAATALSSGGGSPLGGGGGDAPAGPIKATSGGSQGNISISTGSGSNSPAWVMPAVVATGALVVLVLGAAYLKAKN